MAKFIATIKAVITRIIFSAHGVIAIWQVTQYKKDLLYWALCAPIGVLFVEAIFTLAIKKNQEWRWFCPSVFLYLSSVVPAIWLLELDKVERRLRVDYHDAINFTAVGADLKHLDQYLGVQIKLPDIQVDAETWITLIEQFLMLILIIGRWLLPKGDLTRDQLSQLLLVYIGTAADIIEFFDSYKDNTIANEPLLVFLTLGIWSWSLLQFTIVLSATRSRKPRGGGTSNAEDDADNNCCSGCCCSIDVWGIALNILLQDAPFLAFRLLIIIHYKIISYMNVFFTCKNTLVILLQLYRLYVVHTETGKSKKESKPKKGRKKRIRTRPVNISDDEVYTISEKRTAKRRTEDPEVRRVKKSNPKRAQKLNTTRKDTGYSTADSSDERDHKRSKKSKKEVVEVNSSSECESDSKPAASQKRVKSKRSSSEETKKTKQKRDKEFEAVTEESGTSRLDVVNEKRAKKKKKKAKSSSSESE